MHLKKKIHSSIVVCRSFSTNVKHDHTLQILHSKMSIGKTQNKHTLKFKLRAPRILNCLKNAKIDHIN